MRICFVSRRYFPAISGMSVYAQNLLRELVQAGHDVTMISQYRGDAFGTRVYGGGPPPPVRAVGRLRVRRGGLNVPKPVLPTFDRLWAPIGGLRAHGAPRVPSPRRRPPRPGS